VGASDCEQLRDGLIGQPLNTLSSLAYVLVGVWIARRVRGRYATPFGVVVAALGVGSVAYHGPGTAAGRFVHDLSIATVLLFVAVVEIRAGRAVRRRAASVGYRLAAAALLAAAAANLLGRTGAPLCRPGSVFQLHALWHVLTAVALAAWARAALPVAAGERLRATQ
jgi:hypothetical protein